MKDHCKRFTFYETAGSALGGVTSVIFLSSPVKESLLAPASPLPSAVAVRTWDSPG